MDNNLKKQTISNYQKKKMKIKKRTQRKGKKSKHRIKGGGINLKKALAIGLATAGAAALTAGAYKYYQQNQPQNQPQELYSRGGIGLDAKNQPLNRDKLSFKTGIYQKGNKYYTKQDGKFKEINTGKWTEFDKENLQRMARGEILLQTGFEKQAKSLGQLLPLSDYKVLMQGDTKVDAVTGNLAPPGDLRNLDPFILPAQAPAPATAPVIIPTPIPAPATAPVIIPTPIPATPEVEVDHHVETLPVLVDPTPGEAYIRGPLGKRKHSQPFATGKTGRGRKFGAPRRRYGKNK